MHHDLVRGDQQRHALLYIVRVAPIGGVQQNGTYLLKVKRKLEARGLIQRAPAIAGRPGYRWLPTPLGILVATTLDDPIP